jgi:hypothetical protein
MSKLKPDWDEIDDRLPTCASCRWAHVSYNASFTENMKRDHSGTGNGRNSMNSNSPAIGCLVLCLVGVRCQNTPKFISKCIRDPWALLILPDVLLPWSLFILRWPHRPLGFLLLLGSPSIPLSALICLTSGLNPGATMKRPDSIANSESIGEPSPLASSVIKSPKSGESQLRDASYHLIIGITQLDRTFHHGRGYLMYGWMALWPLESMAQRRSEYGFKAGFSTAALRSPSSALPLSTTSSCSCLSMPSTVLS